MNMFQFALIKYLLNILFLSIFYKKNKREENNSFGHND